MDAEDFERAAAARESEKQFLAERDRLIAEWSAGVDVATLGRELDWLRDEVSRLQGSAVAARHRARVSPEAGVSPAARGSHPAIRLT